MDHCAGDKECEQALWGGHPAAHPGAAGSVHTEAPEQLDLSGEGLCICMHLSSPAQQLCNL